MNKLSIAAAAVAATVGLLSAGAASAASTSSSASAEIVAALAISNNVGLQFGQIAPTAVIGTVTVATTGARTSSGGVTLGNQTPPTASSFAITGAPSNTYSISLPDDATVTITGPGAPMTVTGFVSNPAAGTGTGTLSVTGTDTLLVGATLHVGVSQVAGAYAGTFNVAVAYN